MTTHNLQDRLRGYINQAAGFPQLNDDGIVPIAQLGFTATVTEINTVCDGILTSNSVWDPASIAASADLAADVTVTGAALGDQVLVGAGVDVTDLIVSATVTAANTVTIVLFNPTAGAIDLASSTWKIKVFK